MRGAGFAAPSVIAHAYAHSTVLSKLLPWNPDAMARAACNDSLAGRIEGILLPKLAGTVFEKMAEDLLEVLP